MVPVAVPSVPANSSSRPTRATAPLRSASAAAKSMSPAVRGPGPAAPASPTGTSERPMPKPTGQAALPVTAVSSERPMRSTAVGAAVSPTSARPMVSRLSADESAAPVWNTTRRPAVTGRISITPPGAESMPWMSFSKASASVARVIRPPAPTRTGLAMPSDSPGALRSVTVSPARKPSRCSTPLSAPNQAKLPASPPRLPTRNAPRVPSAASGPRPSVSAAGSPLRPRCWIAPVA